MLDKVIICNSLVSGALGGWGQVVYFDDVIRIIRNIIIIIANNKIIIVTFLSS